ncbi:MAG: hypothetical protein AB7J13_07790 [Pyrinomonadaceae bacterium]
MDLEFDKEIDVILRRSREGRGVLVGDLPPKPKTPKHHLDADAIAAFVENAVPAATRMLYIEHFADCDRCRSVLSKGISMNETAASMAAVGAAEVVATAMHDAMPWYRKLLRTPNIAAAMGALVLVFSGVLGFLIFQSRNAETNTIVSQGFEPAVQQGGPSAEDRLAGVAANIAPAPGERLSANANTAVSAEPEGVAALPQKPSNSAAAAPARKLGESKTDGFTKSESDKDKEVAMAEKSVAQPKPVTAPPPPPGDDRARSGALSDSVSTRAEETKDEDAALAKRKAGENRRDQPVSPAKAGPTRGPVQNKSNQVNQNIFDMAVTRVVGGKTFENRDGAWYDRAYRNQKTTNYRRGTDEYKKLDRGLRSIADELGGTVIILWKNKAYRVS